MDDLEAPRRALRAARYPEPSWTPLPAGELAAELGRSHPYYAIERLLGHGGMGAVYLAEDRRDASRVAIKTLRHDELDAPAYVERFAREVDCLRRLAQPTPHPNVVRFLDAGQTPDGYRFFSMELLGGRSLAEVLAGPARLPLRRVVRIMADLCAGAQHAHDRGLVHRDLKAGNAFLVDADGRTVILDWGVAGASAVASTLSRLYGTPGTPGHVAPELLRDSPAAATPAADVFSLGVIFVHLLTGEVPDASRQMPSAYGLDPRLDAVVEKALWREPEGRYANARALAAAIDVAIRPMATASPVPQPSAVPPARREQVAAPSAAPSAPVPVAPASAPSGGAEPLPLPPLTELRDATGPRLERHWGFLASWRTQERLQARPSVPVAEGEQWKVIDQWEACPEIPAFEEIQGLLALRRKVGVGGAIAGVAVTLALAVAMGTTAGYPEGWGWVPLAFGFAMGSFYLGGVGAWGATWLVDFFLSVPAPARGLIGLRDAFRAPETLDPHQVFWHRDKPRIFVSRDYRQMTGWRYPERVPNSGHQPQLVFSIGRVEHVHWSESSFLAQGESFWWWQSGAATYHWTIYDHWGYPTTSVVSNTRYVSLFGPPHCNPWRPRPRHHGAELLLFTSPRSLSVCNVESLPASLSFVRAHDCSEVRRYAKATLDLAPLFHSEHEQVDRFAWHPSGEYLALEIAGRIHLLHWDSAEVIASRFPPAGEKYASVAWSPDGGLLALDESASRVWDLRTDTIRPPAENERWTPRREGELDDKRTSCDGLRSLTTLGQTVHAVNFRAPLDGVVDAAWSPDDPDVFATLGGAGCPRDIRIWQRVDEPAKG